MMNEKGEKSCEKFYRNKFLRRYFILKPYDAFGNRAEEIYFALLKCRREKKRLILLKLMTNLFYKFKFRKSNLELLNIQHPIIVRNPFLDLLNYFVTLVFAIFRIMGIILRKIKYLMGYQPENIFLQASEHPINRNAIWRSRVSWEWDLQNLLNVSYGSRQIIESAFPILKGMKYVCLHVRTGGFFNDHDEAKFRNANIENYFPAIKELVSRGYLVVRLGDSSMPKISLDGVIDYANSPQKSEKNDILLIEHCNFYIGSQSGPIDTAALFEKRILTINSTSLSHCCWYRHGSLFIPRKAVIDNKILSLKEQIEHDLFEIKGTGTMNELVTYRENSCEEILDAVNEFLEFKELDPFQDNFNKFLEEKIIDYFDKTIFFKIKKYDELEKNRWISRLQNMKGSICKGYLVKNWDEKSPFPNN